MLRSTKALPQRNMPARANLVNVVSGYVTSFCQNASTVA